MKRKVYGKPLSRMLAAGLLIQSIPFLFGEFFHIDHFLNGFCKGIGLTLIFFAWFKQHKTQKQNNADNF